MNAPEPQRAPAEAPPPDSGPSWAKLNPGPGGEPVPWKPVLAIAIAGAVAIAAGFIVAAGLSVAPAPLVADRMENFTVANMEQLAINRAALESAGLTAGATIYVRDYADIDGDGVVLNAARVILNYAPTALNIPPGTLNLVAIAGTQGCSSIEIGDGTAVYQLCLRDGDPIRTFTR